MCLVITKHILVGQLGSQEKKGNIKPLTLKTFSKETQLQYT
jgi:hypothetical protein